MNAVFKLFQSFYQKNEKRKVFIKVKKVVWFLRYCLAYNGEPTDIQIPTFDETLQSGFIYHIKRLCKVFFCH